MDLVDAKISQILWAAPILAQWLSGGIFPYVQLVIFLKPSHRGRPFGAENIFRHMGSQQDTYSLRFQAVAGDRGRRIYCLGGPALWDHLSDSPTICPCSAPLAGVQYLEEHD
jgi:hypothetical protein